MPPATVQRIREVTPIKGADFIEAVHVMGWTSVVKKGEFQPGDLCIYVEIDTLVPIVPELEFLRNSCYFKRKDDDTEWFRIRTMKLRGVLSQGLILPLPEGLDAVEGQDVTEFLGAEHYEKPLDPCLGGEAWGQRPSFVRKTDEDRVQSVEDKLEALQGLPYYISQKLDGSSVTYAWTEHKDRSFFVCSRNLELKDTPESTAWNVSRKYGLQFIHVLSDLKDVYIQGELVGPGIQKNRQQLLDHDVYVFNMFRRTADMGWQPVDLEKMVAVVRGLGLKTVPILETGDSFNYTLEELLSKAQGFYPGTKNRQEGIVVRSQDQSISFKVLNNDYLLKDED